VRQPGVVRDEKNGLGFVVISGDRMTWSGLRHDPRRDFVEAVLCVGEEDQSKYGASVLAWGERGVGPKLIGRLPKRLTNIGEVRAIQDDQLLFGGS
jgi:hypothetical protein